MASLGYRVETLESARAMRAAAANVRRETEQLLLGSRLRRGAASGDSTPASIILAITGAALCDPCISRKTGIAEKDIAAALARMAGTIAIKPDFGRCDRCMRPDLLSRLG